MDRGDRAYETLGHNGTYGNLAIDGFWDNAVEAEKARRAQKKASKQQKAKTGKRSSVRLYKSLFQKAQKPLVKQEDIVKVQTKQEMQQSASRAKMLKLCGFIAIGIIITANLGCVIVNQMIMNTQTELVALQRREMELINSNNELKIAVEQLKGPDRIREIATKDLGMVVARDNVYVTSSKVVTVGEVYQQGKLTEDDGVYALVGK